MQKYYHLPRIVAITALVIGLLCPTCKGQSFDSLFVPSTEFNHNRFYLAGGFTVATYTAFAVGLNQLWYADYDRSSFHLFNDWGEWENMDKYGHAYNGYFQSRLIYTGARWTGMNKSSSIWAGVAGSMLFQSTIEVLDGFSTEWGFSIPDMAFNIGGVGAFAIQEALWDDQRIVLKVSGTPVDYPDVFVTSNQGTAINLKDRAQALYGSSFGSQFLKDYNAQTLWASVNPSSFLHNDSKFPKWLNVAVGYGAENMFGGFENAWMTNGESFRIDEDVFRRDRQYYLSMDIDLTRIPVKNQFLKSVLSILNIVKIPSPTLEYRDNGSWHWHWIFF